jgi:hypothetical protein
LARGHAWLLYGLLPLLAFAATGWLYRHVFHCAPITTDENSYIFQAYNFLAGVIARPCPPSPESFFHAMIICDDRVGWLSRYPPGHALWLLPGCLLHQPHLMVALAAALSVGLMARVGALFGGQVAWLAALLLLLSPFFLFTHGTLLGHTSGLLATLLLLYGFMRWQGTGTVLFAALAGLGWSWLYLNRTYTAALLVPPLALYSLITLFRQRHNKTAWLGMLLFAGTAATGVALVLFYNYLALGDAWTMTYSYFRPSETLGFGVKQIDHARVVHTLSTGLRMMWGNLRLYDQWLFGFTGSLVVAAAGALIGWRKQWSPLLLMAPVMVWAGYVLFWYHGPHEVGPAYYTETLPFVVLATALGLARILDFLRARHWAWQCGLLVLCGGWLTSDARFLRQQSATVSTLCQPLGTLREFVQQAPSNSVIVTTEATPFTSRRYGPLVFNPQGLASQPLIVHATGAQDASVIPRMFPHHQAFTLTSTGGQHQLVPLIPAAFNLPLSLAALRRHTGQRLGGDGHQPVVLTAQQARDKPEFLAFGHTVLLPPGRFAAEFDFIITNASANETVLTVDIARTGGRESVVRQACAANTSAPLIVTFAVTHFTTVEPRVFYQGRGDVTLRGIRLYELSP